MRLGRKWLITVVAVVMALCVLLTACDLGRKVQGIEVKFQKKVEAATELSFDMQLEINTDGSVSRIDVSCYKKGNEYAYTFVEPDKEYVVYRRLYADNKLYEYVTDTRLHAGTYYVTDGVAYTDDNNLLYWVTKNIMLATYATLLSTGKQEKVGGVDTYRYDFSYEGNDYSLWYDDSNLVKISATFRSTAEDGTAHTETYVGVFSGYRFAEVDSALFLRPAETKDAVYVESPISFEEWMRILDKFSARAAHWM